MLNEEEIENIEGTSECGLPCQFCRHKELCKLWQDGREVCRSFSNQNTI